MSKTADLKKRPVPGARRPSPSRRRGRRRARVHMIWIVTASVAVVLAVVSIVLTGGVRPADSAAQTASVAIEGRPLPPFSTQGPDPAAGLPIPSVQGTNFGGLPVGIDPQRAGIIIFVAHWCSHCQAEVPRIQRWIDEHGLPDDPRVVSVSTAVDDRAGNYPPSSWLEREKWTVPVIRDDAANSIGRAFGVTSYPAFVVVGAGTGVVARVSGEIPVSMFESWVNGVS